MGGVLPSSWRLMNEDILSLASTIELMPSDLDGGNAAEQLAAHKGGQRDQANCAHVRQRRR